MRVNGMNPDMSSLVLKGHGSEVKTSDSKNPRLSLEQRPLTMRSQVLEVLIRLAARMCREVCAQSLQALQARLAPLNLPLLCEMILVWVVNDWREYFMWNKHQSTSTPCGPHIGLNMVGNLGILWHRAQNWPNPSLTFSMELGGRHWLKAHLEKHEKLCWLCLVSRNCPNKGTLWFHLLEEFDVKNLMVSMHHQSARGFLPNTCCAKHSALADVLLKSLQ